MGSSSQKKKSKCWLKSVLDNHIAEVTDLSDSLTYIFLRTLSLDLCHGYWNL